MSPNKGDYDQRTALMVSAQEGKAVSKEGEGVKRWEKRRGACISRWSSTLQVPYLKPLMTRILAERGDYAAGGWS
jgi:hypothetical protein